RKHKAEQDTTMQSLGVQEGVSEDSFVCGQVNGQPTKPDTITNEWVRWTEKRKPRVRFHDLRHAHATHMLMQGVHPKVAQERLGHSSVAVTMDIYSHVMPGMQADAAKKVGAALSAAIKAQD